MTVRAKSRASRRISYQDMFENSRAKFVFHVRYPVAECGLHPVQFPCGRGYTFLRGHRHETSDGSYFRNVLIEYPYKFNEK